MEKYYALYETSAYKLVLIGTEKGICRIHFNRADTTNLEYNLEFFKDVFEYLLNERDFEKIKMDIKGTGFQMSVWNELTRIEKGTTVTYKNIAERIGRPKAVRAVANAIGKNPLPILIPCHRVIGSNGKLTGFSAEGGIRLKADILTYEGVKNIKRPD